MFENKIGEKLNTFNTSGKSAMEWMGNFTKQIDISDKIQQLNETQLMKNPLTQGVAAAATSLTQNNQNNQNNLSASPSQIETSLSSTSLSNNTNKTPNNNNKESNSPIETNQNLQRQNKIQNGDEQIETDKSNNIKSKSKPQQSQQSNGDEIDYDQKLKQISEEIMNNQAKSNEKNPNRNRRNSTSNNNEDNHDFYVNARQLLTRQSTEMTSTFPSKAFHGKINSQTIEIPGLNVKVVRYKNMENDIGKIDPNLYRNYSSSKGADSNAGISKGKLFFSLRFNEEIQSFSVNIIKAELAAPERNPSGTPSITISCLLQ